MTEGMWHRLGGKSYLPILIDAVNLARNEQITSVRALKARLVSLGYPEDQVADVIQVWVRYVAHQP